MAKATFPAQSQTVAETAKPADADGFVASDHRNVGSALFQGDVAVLRPRAKSPAGMAINVAAATVESFFRQVYYNSAQSAFAGGDSPTFTAPTTNPRIDLLYLNSSGTLAIQQGTEAASPVPPTYPNLAGNLPLCEVYLKVGMTKIINFEDSGANPAEGYLYRDVRPWMSAGSGGGPHEATHATGGSDAFTATDLLEAIVKRLRESGGTTLLLGAVADGQLLKRSGTSVVGASVSSVLELIARQTGSIVTTISFTGLNGDADDVYMVVIEGEVRDAGDTKVRLNGRTAGENWRYDGHGTIVPSNSGTDAVLGFGHNQGSGRYDLHVEAWISAQGELYTNSDAGDKMFRMATLLGGFVRKSGFSSLFHLTGMGQFRANADNITQLDVVFPTNGFTGIVTLYRLKQA
ncbi:MAG: hypothetical protein HY600_05315 [Candidatus Omnitrophica bacterium]|nr:hypothetical protein [Candidatus Omnitrophota bacterium]